MFHYICNSTYHKVINCYFKNIKISMNVINKNIFILMYFIPINN